MTSTKLPYLVLLLLAATLSPPVVAEPDAPALLNQAQQLFKPLPTDAASAQRPINALQVALGRTLFFDPRISLDGTVSCSRCHLPALYGTDGLPKALGVMARPNPRNAPTVLNAALEFVAHWRGDRKDVEDQAKQALVGPPSFGNPDYAAAMAKIKAIPGYEAQFEQAFPEQADPVTPDNWATAIGAYERTLLTPSPFDAYLGGDVNALSPEARTGLAAFIATGCTACHNGVGVGGGSFQKFGVTEDNWKATGSGAIDKGRFDVTKRPEDMYVFKVPSLRNVAMTAPYFHDGSVATLIDAVRVMARVQLGKTLTDEDASHIVAFLGSLTGSLPAAFAEAPTLPPSAFEPPK
jgi:cytochrome c peroxidase